MMQITYKDLKDIVYECIDNVSELSTSDKYKLKRNYNSYMRTVGMSESDYTCISNKNVVRYLSNIINYLNRCLNVKYFQDSLNVKFSKEEVDKTLYEYELETLSSRYEEAIGKKLPGSQRYIDQSFANWYYKYAKSFLKKNNMIDSVNLYTPISITKDVRFNNSEEFLTAKNTDFSGNWQLSAGMIQSEDVKNLMKTLVSIRLNDKKISTGINEVGVLSSICSSSSSSSSSAFIAYMQLN